MLRKVAVLLPFLAVLSLMSVDVMAADRIIEGQGKYLTDTTSVFEVGMKGLLFVMGLGAIGFSAWQMLSDYVFAKSDHEKKFSIGVLIAGMLIGSVLCVPYGAIMIGTDITGVNQESNNVDDEDFERAGPATD
jgi:hypothetical protein